MDDVNEEEDDIASLGERDANELVDDEDTDVFIDGSDSVVDVEATAAAAAASNCLFAFKEESVSKLTVGGKGFGIGFSTGFVKPSFISCRDGMRSTSLPEFV
jgi:hypothetical protein